MLDISYKEKSLQIWASLTEERSVTVTIIKIMNSKQIKFIPFINTHKIYVRVKNVS